MITIKRENFYSYLQLTVVVVAAGTIFPLLYLRQNFEVSILDTFQITVAQLSNCYAVMGLIFFASYIPSGWLADHFSPRVLLILSLLLTLVFGLWFSEIPGYSSLLIIFVGWGFSTGLTFWAAHLKIVSMIASVRHQGRFFGLLDGGRGLVEAVLGTLAIAAFAYSLKSDPQGIELALRQVIYIYCSALVIALLLVYGLLDDTKSNTVISSERHFLPDLKIILSHPDVWLSAVCILCGYQLFWATYSFSAHLQQTYSLTAVTVGSITVAKLWMRPIGAISAGYAGDLFGCERMLAILMVLASCCITTLALLPIETVTTILLTMVLAAGLATYAVRGLYWSTLNNCEIPDNLRGLAIGMISLIGYLPDMYLPLLSAKILEHYPGRPGYQLYFFVLSLCGIAGSLAALTIKRRRDCRISTKQNFYTH